MAYPSQLPIFLNDTRLISKKSHKILLSFTCSGAHIKNRCWFIADGRKVELVLKCQAKSVIL